MRSEFGFRIHYKVTLNIPVQSSGNIVHSLSTLTYIILYSGHMLQRPGADWPALAPRQRSENADKRVAAKFTQGLHVKHSG